MGVIGGGLMGSGIAEVCIRAGVDVTLIEVDDAAAAAAGARIERSLDRGVGAGKLAAEERDGALERLDLSGDLDRVEGADAAIEAVVESERIKRDLFGRLDKLLPDASFLASNTSSVPIMKLAAETARPDRVLGLHFFNPVPVMRLVEVIPSIMTSAETLEVAKQFASQRLSKEPIDSQDRAGFIVNALLIPYLLSAIRMYESGFASKEDIDSGMKLGCAHPMGPLALADLVGLDTVLAVAESLYDEFRDPGSVAPALLNRMVEAGLLGRKSGQGFYSYDGSADA
jgi:3-hydroxybutyryl-CoA dehydrogenase